MRRLFLSFSFMVVLSAGPLALAQTNFVTHVVQPDSIQTPSICMVSVSPDNKNIIIWEKIISTNTDSFRIYRESPIQSGQWDLIGVQEYAAYSLFIDSTVDPTKQSYSYKIASKDKCGNETNLSSEHKTINLTLARGTNNDWSLSWDQYIGFNVSSYRIYRGSSADSLQMIDSTAANTLNYSDSTLTQGQIYYQIEGLNPGICNPSTRKSGLLYNSSRSNIASNSTENGISTFKPAQGLIIYPNPFTNNTTVSFLNPGNHLFKILIYDLTGKVLFSMSTRGDQVVISKGNLADGVYILEVNGTQLYKGKLVINQ